MALDFPNSPITGATYTGPGGVIWAWDGQKWVNGTQIGTAYAPIKDPIFTGNPTAPTPPAGDADTSLATTQFVAAATGTALNNVGRNLIHNPLFNIAQRGTTAFSVSGYTLDRWRMDFNLDTMNVQQIDSVDAVRTTIGDEASTKLMFVGVTGNAGAASFSHVNQRIEDVRRLAGKTVIVSFYAYATAGTPKIGVAASQIFGTGGSPSAQVDINGTSVTISTTATRYSVTISFPSSVGKTVGTNGDSYTRLMFFLSSGANNNVFAGSVGVQTANFLFWGVQLEVGSVATPLEKPDPQQDLAKCQRFYQTTSYIKMISYGAAGNLIGYSQMLPVQMRAAPSVVFSGTSYSNCSGLTADAALKDALAVYVSITAAGNASFYTAATLSADL
jgi:hypothetical protein